VPVAAAVSGDDTVAPGILPGGRYATLPHTGPFSELAGVTARLLAWAGDQGLALDMTRTDDSERWGCRLESYLTDPAREPDPGKWQTELAFRLAG
jgi:effector-binding domain-containing protein